MLFKYQAIDKFGEEKEGFIEALNSEVAVNSLQNRGLVVSAVESAEKTNWWRQIPWLNRVSMRDIVIVSRQMATLFEARVSALRVFRLIASETRQPILRQALNQVADDLQEGSSISQALARHPQIFSNFFINMVKVGEETGKIEQVFSHLADYLDRVHTLTSKAKHALIYPTFVITAFIGVMILILTVVVPRIAPILQETEAELPLATKIVLGLSGFLVDYGIFLAAALLIAGFFAGRYFLSSAGKLTLSNLKLLVPGFSNLYRKLYLTRIADNLNTMISGGVPILQALESTSETVDNDVYRAILQEAAIEVKAGKSLSSALGKYQDIPSVMTQMIRVGEETGELANILRTLSVFYEREVNAAVDSLIDLIQPAIIILLGLGVGVLLAAVLMPIYNIAGAF